MTWIIEILEYHSTRTAEDDTTSSKLYIANHGIHFDDMIVNLTKRTDSTERGCRMVVAPVETNTFEIDRPITGQEVFDSIALFKYEDRSSYINSGSLSLDRQVAGQSTCQFTINTQKGDFFPTTGQKVRIKRDGNVVFRGFINTIKTTRPDMGRQDLFLDIQCSNLTQIAVRRTIRVEYAIGTAYSTVVNDMLNGYLYQEGIKLGTVNTGASLDDDWVDDCISISDVLDKCASSSAYQWFVDDYGYLQFLRDIPIVNAEHALVDGNGFTDFNDVSIDETLDGYANKVFFTGGSDGSGNPVIISNTNSTEYNRRQLVEGGTGVYGSIIRDSSISDSEYHTAEANTSSTSVVVTAHGQFLGWTIWNLTKNQYSTISNITGNDSFDISPAITGQTQNDKIVFFPIASDIIKNAIQKQAVPMKKFSFNSGTTDWTPGKRLNIKLDTMNIPNSYWLIERVNIYDPQQNNKQLRCKVEATLRDSTEFKTSRNINYRDYFMNLGG